MAGNRAAVTSRTMSLCSLKKKESPRIISAEAPRSLNWSSAGPIASRLSASAISTPTPSAAVAFLIDANCSSLHASLGLLKEAFPDMVSNLVRPDGNITGFASLSLELHIYIARRPPELVDEIGPIGDQAAGGGEAAFKIDCGQFVTGRQRNDQIAMKRSRPAPRYDQTPVRRAHEGRKGALSLMWGAHVDWVYLHAERRGQGLDDAELADSGGVRGISKDCLTTYTAISVIGLDIYAVVDGTVGPCRLQCCRMVITIYQKVMRLFPPRWQHHRLMIASTVAPLIQYQVSLIRGGGISFASQN